jgi:hypothetical protein
MRGIAQLVLLGVVLLATTGCGSGRTVTGGTSTNNPDGGSGGTGGTGTVDFATQIQPIFDNNCAFSGCHAADTASGGMVLDAGKSYSNLVNVTSSEVAPDKRVVPGNGNASYIIEKLTKNPPRSGERMPLGVAGGLPSNEIALIRTWIDEGAHAALQ